MPVTIVISKDKDGKTFVGGTRVTEQDPDLLMGVGSLMACSVSNIVCHFTNGTPEEDRMRKKLISLIAEDFDKAIAELVHGNPVRDTESMEGNEETFNKVGDGNFSYESDFPSKETCGMSGANDCGTCSVAAKCPIGKKNTNRKETGK